MAKTYFRFISPIEKRRYGCRSSANYITTHEMRFNIGSKHTVTVPGGFVCDGFSWVENDFCVLPVWIAWEYLYSTHRFDKGVCCRSDVDLLLFQASQDTLVVHQDELYFSEERVTGDDVWKEMLERGVTIIPELITSERGITYRPPNHSIGGGAVLLPGWLTLALAAGGSGALLLLLWRLVILTEQ